ncbi:MAG TPA: hypothetical protein PKD83_06090 [Ignavibacteria bacterium]|nr:hypothetical protein [Ignavibacteria bacterium]
MKKFVYTLYFLSIICLLNSDVYSQQKNYFTYTRPSWVVGFGPSWLLATNDAYGRANYNNNSQVLYDNYGMRWGIGGYIYGKYSPGKLKNDRIYLSVDYKSMTNSDFSDNNKTSYNFETIAAGYEYLFYGNYRFRSYYGAGLTGNFISGDFTPNPQSATNFPQSFQSTFRVGMEIKAGLEFVFKNSKRNLGLNVGARYNLANLFDSDNADAAPGPDQYLNQNLNDGSDGERGGPGYKRYIGILSIDVGLNIYPDVKKKTVKR